MNYLAVCFVAFFASALTFFSGFGLRTLLLPAFAVFVPVELAVAMTGVVHILNGIFKLGPVGRLADRSVVLRFGLPAIGSAVLGTMALARLARLPAHKSYMLAGELYSIEPVQLTLGVLLLVFAGLEFSTGFRRVAISSRWMPPGAC